MEFKNIYFYITIFIVIAILGFILKKAEKYFGTTNDYELIQNYLLNTSPLYSYGKPKIWIHSKFEINSRKWNSFNERNSTELNQPYINVCLKTIINHCANEFHICLIDDKSFTNLIPNWDIELNELNEPEKEHFRMLGLSQIVYHYGGFVLPNSFVCLQSLKSLYDEYKNGIFFAEEINRGKIVADETRDCFIGGMKFFYSAKQHPKMAEFIEWQKENLKSNFNSISFKINNLLENWIMNEWRKGEIDIICGKRIGIKSKINKPIEIDELLRNEYLPLDENVKLFGIYIDADELLLRQKYCWFASLDEEELFDKDCIIIDYMKKSLVETSNIYYEDTKIKSKISEF